MRKFLGIVLSVVLLCGGIFLPAKAEEEWLHLPDGGKLTNSGVARVYGRTSGGTDGYANISCELELLHGVLDDAGSNDEAMATLWSDVIGSMNLLVNCTIYYVGSEEYEKAANLEQTQYLTSAWFWSIVEAENDYAYKTTAGYSMTTNTRGKWIAGTIVEIEG